MASRDTFPTLSAQVRPAHELSEMEKCGPRTILTAYIHIYIYKLWCYYLGQVWSFEVLLSGPSLFFTKHCLSKKHYKIGVSAICFLKKNCARKFEVLLSGPSWSFLRCSQLGPDNNTYLAQIITPQNAYFFNFLLLKICWNTYFYSVFWTSTKIWQKKGQKKNDNFSHFAKHRFIKKPFCCNCFFCCFFCAFQFVLFETKNIDVEQKT